MSDAVFQFVAAQADVCRLLSACYYEPGPEFVEDGLFDSLATAAAQLDPEMGMLAVRLKDAFLVDSTEDLLIDYARMFLGPGHVLAPPYESAWRDKNSDDPLESVNALVELYDDGGFAVDPEFRDLPDHVAVELEFLYTLIFQRAAAIRRDDPDALTHAKALQCALLERHLNLWLDAFLSAVLDGAESRFYRELATLTSRFVRKLRETSCTIN